MGLCVTFVSGVRRSGKSAVIRMMIDRLWKREPHYLRLVRTGGDKQRPKPLNRPPPNCGVASAQWLKYDSEHIFEILPAALSSIHKKDRYGSVVIEADADATLRCAYPYDHRVFVMPIPSDVGEVFRDPRRAAVELQRVLDDTQAFASEIFGLRGDSGAEDVDPHEDRRPLSTSQMRRFLYSPLGDELATRVQLSPAYHGLVESEVVIVNASVGRFGPGTLECIHRITNLLERVRGVSDHSSDLFQCDPCDPSGQTAKKLLQALSPMCRGGT